VTAASGETRATAGGQSLLPATRASYGATLVLAPGAVIYLATGRLPERRARRVAQLLGARHLIQAGVSAVAPVPAVLAVGAGIDSVHAASMLILAAVGRGTRRATLTDGLAETLLAASGFRRAWAAALRGAAPGYPQISSAIALAHPVPEAAAGGLLPGVLGLGP
jgi:hypothetical protein